MKERKEGEGEEGQRPEEENIGQEERKTENEERKKDGEEGKEKRRKKTCFTIHWLQ